jgi:RimJ/RimL family protein N-acetyltransferase
MSDRSFFYNHKNGISLRKLDSTDLATLRDLKDESWFGTVNFAVLNSEDQKAWFEKISKDRSCLYLIAHCTLFKSTDDYDDDPPVGLYGFTDINPVNRTCSFTHSVYEGFRGKGLGKKTLQAGVDFTFEVYNMRRIDTWILENNIAELKTAQSVGFQIEGTARKAVFKCGQYLDCHYLGLLREEWGQNARIKGYSGVCNTSYQPKNKI